jgi:hypothetical protein
MSMFCSDVDTNLLVENKKMKIYNSGIFLIVDSNVFLQIGEFAICKLHLEKNTENIV